MLTKTLNQGEGPSKNVILNCIDLTHNKDRLTAKTIKSVPFCTSICYNKILITQ
jgi:hypothetical protein